MEHLIEEMSWLQDKIFLRGLVFGLVHVGIMLIGYYTGWSINRLLKIVSNGFIAGGTPPSTNATEEWTMAQNVKVITD